MAFSFRAGISNWRHDFPKLARESGFHFNMHGCRVRVDWNRIRAIDIDRVIGERDFSTIDHNINNVIDYCLESEYDVKILDPNFVKLFRLAQLSVEYLLYCKQYLDHSVIILKDELRQKIEQNVSMKKEIATLEDTVKNLKERSREKRKLIETSVGEISNGEVYKCPHCPKTFVRAIFVNAHIARKHSYISDMGVSASPVHDHYRAETEKLHNEIKALKERLNQTERVIRNESDKLLDNTGKDYARDTRKNEYDKDKVDTLQEQSKYQEDIGSLKSMLFDEIRALREKDHVVNESIPEANVKTLISQQEKEIENLRKQLLERLTPGMENMQAKLQTQEGHWRAKIEDMEAQHRHDIEKLTTELKATQQVADRIKSEYESKVQDLEKQSVDQSNMLVEQKKQLNCLSREINSQIQINHKTREENAAEFHKSTLLTAKHSSDYDDKETCKTLNNTEAAEVVIEDIGRESSQEYSDKLMPVMAQPQYVSNKDNTVKSKGNTKIITDSRTVERMTGKPNLKKSDKLVIVKKTKNDARDCGAFNEVNNGTNKSFITKENSIDVNKKCIGIREKKKTLHTDNIKTNKRPEFLERHSASSVTESGTLSSMSETETDSESATTDESVKTYEPPAVKSSNAKTISIREDVRNMFDNRLRELGIDPEWQGIPTATYKQKMEIIRHQQNINAKKLVLYNQIKQKVLEDVLQRISTNHKESKYSTLMKSSPLDKLVTHVKSKAWKAFSKDRGEYTSVQKTEDTTPLKLRLKQKIELLPKKYKDELYENTRDSPLRKSEADICTSPKVISTYQKSIQSIFSASSIESQEDIKQISPTKITVSDSNARKVNSPISRKQMVASKFSENNDSDSTIMRQDYLVLSPKNKSALKPTSGSVSSLIKKKVLFDLDEKEDDTMIPENDKRKNQISSNDWSVSSFAERGEYGLQKEKSMSTGNIVLKTSQSDKIAEISKKIQEQLSIARKPPVGSVETIFRFSASSQDFTNYNAGNQLLNSTSLVSSILDNPLQNLTSPKAKGNIFPQPAPRTVKDKDLSVPQRKSEIKYSDLDSDIDEILQME